MDGEGVGGAGTVNQGFKGGNVTRSDIPGVASAGAGGGAGGAAANRTNETGFAAGGIGLSSSITGAAVLRGVGGPFSTSSALDGPANTGNGGAGQNSVTINGHGGSGIVIVRYLR
jgi:hypothetical protein